MIIKTLVENTSTSKNLGEKYSLILYIENEEYAEKRLIFSTCDEEHSGICQ